MTGSQLSAETLDALRRIDSATIANAIEHFNVRDPVTGYASLELRCQFPEQEPMVGFAVTATQDTTSAGDDRPLRLPEVLDMVHAAPKPAVLVVQYTGADRLRSCVAGDMFSTALQKLGAVGLVTDMGSRDFGGIQQRAPGFQLFCPGAGRLAWIRRLHESGYNSFDLRADHSTGLPVARGRQRRGVDPSRYRRRRYCPSPTRPGGGEILL